MAQCKVLALIDGSEYSLLILHYIKQFLVPKTHAIILFCVQEEMGLSQAEPLPFMDSSTERGQKREAAAQELRTELLPHQKSLEAVGFTTSIEVRYGDPLREIDRFLDENPVDLIAMTTHGRTGLRRVLLGSVAQHLIRHSARPILLYRPFDYA